MKKLLKTMACMVAAVFTVTPVAAEDTENWIVVNLETPGNLGVEILYQADKLADVTHLRVSGEINSTDWATIQNLTRIQVIDLENAITTLVPEKTFYYCSSLTTITLPKTIKSIENSAFYRTSLNEITFPASLETIGQSAFQETKVKSVKFAEGNKLKSLGKGVFSKCDSLKTVTFTQESKFSFIPEEAFRACKKLSSINLPESVTSIDSYAFYFNSNLSQIDLPGNLTFIGECAFYNTGLVNITIPQYVNYIGYEAFSYSKLQEVELPTSCHNLKNGGWQFNYCDNIKKVICKSPTPPYVDNSFHFDRSKVTLVVPDFAVPDYKLDSYWLGFGSIEGGAKSDYWDIYGTVSLNNDHRLEGTPSITIKTSGCLNILGNAPMPIDHFKMFYSQYTQNSSISSSNFRFSQLINNSPLMTANRVDAKYSIYRNTWHFLALPFDVKVDDICHSDSTAEYVIRYYDGAERATANKTGNSWKDVPTGTVIKAGTGIIIQSNKQGDITFPCADDGRNTIFNPNSMTMELTANPAESNAHSGWNFIANPYPCYYDMYYSMLSCPITVYSPGNNNYFAYSLIDDDVVLWPNRPFFIQASDDVKEIVFSNAGRQFSSEVSRPSGAPSQSHKTTRALFNISLSCKCNGLTDNTRVVINPEAMQDYELNRDASKFFSENPEIPQVYTISSGEEYLAINERDEADGLVRLGFYAPAAGEMSLMLTRIDGDASLSDAVTKETTVLGEGTPYDFTVSESGFDNGRFTLILKAPGTTSVNGISTEGAAAVTVDGNIIRVNNAAGKEVVICSADGKVYVKETAAADRMEYAMPCGLYIIKAGAASTKCLIK